MSIWIRKITSLLINAQFSVLLLCWKWLYRIKQLTLIYKTRVWLMIAWCFTGLGGDLSWNHLITHNDKLIAHVRENQILSVIVSLSVCCTQVFLRRRNGFLRDRSRKIRSSTLDLGTELDVGILGIRLSFIIVCVCVCVCVCVATATNKGTDE